MNSTSPATIEEGVAAQYSRKKINETEVQGRAGRAVRQTLSLGSFVKPFYVFGGNFLKMLWRAMVAVIHRVASVFKVDVKMSDLASAYPDGRGGAPVAEFISNDTSSGGVEAVQSAAKESAKDLSALVTQLTSRKVDKDRLRGPDAAAHAALNLQALGSALDVARVNLAETGRGLDAAALAASEDCGAPVESLRILLASYKFNSQDDAQFFSPEVQDVARKHAEIKAHLGVLELQFSELAIESLRAADVSGLADLDRVVRAKVSQFASEEMAGLIFEEYASENLQIDEEIQGNSDSLNIESQNAISPSHAGANVKVAQVLAEPTRRQRWLGLSAGVVDDLRGCASEGANRASRER